jgi:hypothetical protein
VETRGFSFNISTTDDDRRPIAHLAIPLESHEEADLVEWWITTAAQDYVSTIPKMLEYGGDQGTSGAADLRIMGDALATMLGWGAMTPVALEMACWYYTLGKVGRLVSDYQQQRHGKTDTWFDICVYAMMARRIQEVGQWP